MNNFEQLKERFVNFEEKVLGRINYFEVVANHFYFEDLNFLKENKYNILGITTRDNKVILQIDKEE